MKIEEKVVSLELANRMKELGWEFETERYWGLSRFGKLPYELIPFKRSDTIPAPDAIEILHVLPNCVYLYKAADGIYDADYKNYVCPGGVTINNSAERLGNLWCYLKERSLT